MLGGGGTSINLPDSASSDRQVHPGHTNWRQSNRGKDYSELSLGREYRSTEINPAQVQTQCSHGKCQEGKGQDVYYTSLGQPWASGLEGIQENVIHVLSQEGISPVYSKSCKDSLSCDTPSTHLLAEYLLELARKLPEAVSWLLR